MLLDGNRIERFLQGGKVGFKDHALAGLAVHHHHKWRRELQVADAALLLDYRLRSQPLPIDESLTGIGVDGEVANLKGGEVLEEMTALRRNHAQVAESRLDNHPCSGDLVPGHRNSEPGVRRSPAAHSDQ